MGSKVRARLTTRRALVVIVGVAFALSWVVPSFGASAFKLAVKALGRANTAVHDSNVAVATSNSANGTANTANSTANAAKSTANTAQSTANTANSTANQALNVANSIVPGARAFAHVNSGCALSSNCPFNRSRDITTVRQTNVHGIYCIAASGLSSSTTSWVASVDDNGSTGTLPFKALPSTASNCNSGEFEILTEDGTDTPVSTIAFFVLIP